MRVPEAELFDLPEWHVRQLDPDQQVAYWRERIRRNDAARALSYQLSPYAWELERHRGQRVAASQRRRGRIRTAPSNDLTSEQWLAIQAQWDYRCAYCGTVDRKLEMEHVIPIARGGSHTAANIVPACGPCNRRKGTRPALPFYHQS